MSDESQVVSTIERLVQFESVFNFRDLGGYETADGRTVRWRTLYRADGIHRLSGEELDRFGAIGIRTVVDLRTPKELEERGQMASDLGHAYHHLPVLESVWDRELVDASEDPVEFLAGRYLDMLDVGAKALAAAIELVADPANLPLVFHCAAGKDRTGVLAALVLHLLGVADDQIADDYSLSAAGVARWQEWIIATMPEAREKMADQPRAFMEAPADAMRLFLGGVRDRHGSVESYVRSIGVSDRVVAQLRSSLLE